MQGDLKKAGGISLALVSANLLEAGLIRPFSRHVMNAVLSLLTGREPKEEDDETEEERRIIKILGEFASNVPFLGPLFYGMVYKETPFPVLAMFSEVFKTGGELINDFTSEDTEDSEKAWGVFNAMLSLIPGLRQFQEAERRLED